MKRFISMLLFLSLLLLSFAACATLPEDSTTGGGESGSEKEEESTSEKPKEKVNSMTEFYDQSNVDFDLPLFDVAVPKSQYDKIEARVAILSDNHYKTFGGVGGYTDAQRQQMMIDALLADPEGFDCVIFNGDMVNQNDLYKAIAGGNLALSGQDYLQEWINTYFSQLRRAGVRAYCVQGSHDATTPEEFKGYFGYENNYVILAGTTAYICVDVFSGARNDTTYETTAADIPKEFVDEVEKLLAHEYVQNAFVVYHRRMSFPNLDRLVAMDKVQGTIYGDSHYNEVTSYQSKPSMNTGHFSRGYTKMITWGLGFTPFVPTAFNMPSVIDENGNTHRDWSATGSPWQYRVVEFRGNNEEYTLESYQVFPEISYKAFSSDGNNWAAFTQEYTEARPSFLGEDAVVDKSYKLVKDVKKTTEE